mmetsp:Transcript_26854/g.57565  ORF Transcript_26854/g.57565 Transcript_26854/m.57565 type:complete len:340 (-) Transcript_26854:842-1861(-)
MERRHRGIASQCLYSTAFYRISCIETKVGTTPTNHEKVVILLATASMVRYPEDDPRRRMPAMRSNDESPQIVSILARSKAYLPIQILVYNPLNSSCTRVMIFLWFATPSRVSLSVWFCPVATARDYAATKVAHNREEGVLFRRQAAAAALGARFVRPEQSPRPCREQELWPQRKRKGPDRPRGAREHSVASQGPAELSVVGTLVLLPFLQTDAPDEWSPAAIDDQIVQRMNAPPLPVLRWHCSCLACRHLPRISFEDRGAADIQYPKTNEPGKKGRLGERGEAREGNIEFFQPGHALDRVRKACETLRPSQTEIAEIGRQEKPSPCRVRREPWRWKTFQ